MVTESGAKRTLSQDGNYAQVVPGIGRGGVGQPKRSAGLFPIRTVGRRPLFPQFPIKLIQLIGQVVELRLFSLELAGELNLLRLFLLFMCTLSLQFGAQAYQRRFDLLATCRVLFLARA